MKYIHRKTKKVQDSEKFEIERRRQIVNTEGTWTFIHNKRVLVRI